MKKQCTIFLILIFALILVPTNYIKDARAADIPAPIAYYDFNDETSINTGAINDKTGNYNGQNYNGIWTSDGYNGGAMIFDCAKGDYGMKTSPLPDLNNYTLLYRVNVSAGDGRSITYATGDGFSLSITYGSSVESYNNNFNINSSGIPNLDYKFNSDDWEHMTIVYNGGENILYRNGVEVGRASLMEGLPSPVLASSQWIFGGVPGGCPKGSNLQLDEIKIYNAALTAGQILEEYNNTKMQCRKDTWECGNWGTCSASGEQTRTCTKTYDCESVDTPSPSAVQSCTYIPPIPFCTSNNWSCASWSTCSSSGSQTRTCNKTSNCQGGASSPATSQSCTYTPTCTELLYSLWSECGSDGKQTRKVVYKYPANCEGGEIPELTRSCSYTPAAPTCSADTWQCGNWGICSPQGIQTRSCNRTYDCPSAETAAPATSQYCEAPNQPKQQSPTEDLGIVNQDSIVKSTVKLICPVDKTKGKQGSGTIIDSSGTILTNKHVIESTRGCWVGFVDHYNDEPYFGDRQIADIYKVSSDADVAILKLRNPSNKSLISVNISQGNSSNIKLGEILTTYGYPAKFGTKITYTSGDFSGANGSYLKTTAIIDSGNSGGGAYLKNGTFIGIPSRVSPGNFNIMGEILSINKINSWINNSPITYDNSSSNNYSRVSSILESFDLNELGSLGLFVAGDEKNVKTGAENKIDKNLSNKLKGKILLQVESHGEAWYVNPKTGSKHYMANGNEAYRIMRYLGVGITNKDLEKIKANKSFSKKNSGKIFLQVEANGEAYYIDFSGNAHYLKDGSAAYSIMRDLGLGIKNADLSKIAEGSL